MFEVTSFESGDANDKSVRLEVDPVLLGAVIQGTRLGLRMSGADVVPVGASRLTTARHGLTVMVGLVGNLSGNLALNLSEPATLHLAGGLLGTKFRELNEDGIDAVMELGNMVAGALKTALAGSVYSISNISLPSLVLGTSYSMAYARGIRTVSVEFEISELPFSAMNARYFSSTVSLLPASGG